MIAKSREIQTRLAKLASHDDDALGVVQAKQSVRLGRFRLAALTYAIGAGLIVAAWLFGLMSLAPALAIIGGIVVVNAALYVALRTGINLRSGDPSLTKPQVYAAITILMVALYYSDQGRGLGVGLAFVIFLFGVFRLTTREFFTITLYTIAAYALVINLQMYLRPQVISNVYVEWFSWLLLAGTLPWFGLIGGRLSALRARLRSSNRDLVRALDTIRTMATRDELTGLYNRAVFGESLRHALAQHERHMRPLALFFLDADRFKVINDTLGHAIGDRVLTEVSERLVSCVRDSDVVARLGGDEFVVLIEDYRSQSDLDAIAGKIISAMAEPLQIEHHDVPLSVSIGIALAPEHGRDETTLLRNADAAMYRAKEIGRNGYCIYTEQMNQYAEERLQLESEMRRAAERDELRLYFQPKVEIATGRITGVEALVRWQHPRHGLLQPDRFIGIAEETGAVIGIGRWVLREACLAARRWQQAHGLHIGVAVNLSPRQFHSQSIVNDLDDALRDSGIDPTLLDLEITETMVMHNPEQAGLLMRELCERGVRLSMDDFGTGYSSLGFLKRFPIHNVKIDRAFVRDLPHRGDDVAIARAVIAMARSLNLSVTAEGVEREDQVAFLRAEGCETYQGYLCSAPVPEAEFVALAVRLQQETVAAGDKRARLRVVGAGAEPPRD